VDWRLEGKGGVGGAGIIGKKSCNWLKLGKEKSKKKKEN
jgi:hypothetical protein